VATPSEEPIPVENQPIKASTGGAIAEQVEAVPSQISWKGNLTPQQFGTFYMKVLLPLSKSSNLKIEVMFEATPESALSRRKSRKRKCSARIKFAR
jgi:hypothetical protein